jgi:propionyl-CoA synthetase
MIREQIGPVAAFRRAVVVNRLPKTRSGKILRSTLSKIVDRIDFNMPPTIDDPEILTEIRNTLLKVGVLEE